MERSKTEIDPSVFYWGAATSAHQVEGNTQNDWSKWERENADRLVYEAKRRWEPWQQKKFPEMFDVKNYISGIACDHYHRYEEDFDLVREGGHNAHRFSIEWSRVEPEEGVFDEDALRHYKDVVKALRMKGLEPFVTLWHWTLPVWLSRRGGILAQDFSEMFSRYAQKMVEVLKEDVVFFMTFNEPNSIITNGYITGQWPPQKKNIFLALRGYKNLAKAHTRAYQDVKVIHPSAQVGFTEFLTSFKFQKRYFLSRSISACVRYWGNEQFLARVIGKYDFLGVQNYLSIRVSLFGSVKLREDRSDLGWGVDLEGLKGILKQYAKVGVPLYVTEDGLADANDHLRGEFLRKRIASVKKAVSEGVDVRGYFHWSLMDNFEWDKGFWPKFGLVEIDRKTLERKPRKSFHVYKDIIRDDQMN